MNKAGNVQKERLLRRKKSPQSLTLKLYGVLESIIGACSKAEGTTKKQFVEFLLSSAADDFVDFPDAPHSYLKQYKEALAWSSEEHPHTRKTRYLSSNTARSLDVIQRSLDCSRDDAFNTGCAIGLITQVENLKEDCHDLETALHLLQLLSESETFKKFDELLPKIDFGYRDELEPLSTSTRQLSILLAEILEAKEHALNHIRGISIELPGYLQELLKKTTHT